jgi:hypothetical protein
MFFLRCIVNRKFFEQRNANMAQLDLQEFKPYILKQLTRGKNIDDIILHVCEKTGVSWQSAREYVNIVNEENRDDIVLGQSPLLAGLALVMFLAGAGMILSTIYRIYTVYTGSPQDLSYFLKENLSSMLRFVITGIIMIIGSLKGMTDVWASIFKKNGNLLIIQLILSTVFVSQVL